MAMLNYSEITKGKFIVYEGGPYEVLDAHVFRKQQRKPVNAVKLKNLITREIVLREILIEGLISVANGENPRLIERKLQGYLG